MPNDDFYIICPYYHKAKGKVLFCKGFSGDDAFETEDCFIKQVFKTQTERNGFIKKYCVGFSYTGCAIAALNEYLEGKKLGN